MNKFKTLFDTSDSILLTRDSDTYQDLDTDLLQPTNFSLASLDNNWN